MREEWKDIEGYEGLYQVSNMGRVRSLDRIIVYKDGRVWNCKGRILKNVKGKNGYLYVNLSKVGNVGKPQNIHRLVAIAFIPNPDNLPQVNHKDEDKTNNTVDNLEWCTAKYNCNYGTAKERQKSKVSKQIMGINKINGYIITFQSAKEAERKTGINCSHISSCCKGRKKYKSAGGYIWMYID